MSSYIYRAVGKITDTVTSVAKVTVKNKKNIGITENEWTRC
jgi:hypothetical protein